MAALRLYYETLIGQGVSARDFTWEELLLDYRLSILDWLLKMECFIAACEDWECMALA